MFFIKTAKILAYIIFVLALIRIGTGFLIAFGTPSMADNESASRMVLAAANSGEAIDEGFTYLLGAVVLGVLAEIGTFLRNLAIEHDDDAEE